MDRKPKIAFVIDDLGYAGAQKQLTLLAGALRDEFEPQVYCLSRRLEPYGPRLEAAGIRVLSFRYLRALSALRLPMLISALRREAVDVVHGFLDASDVYAYVAARRLGLPVLLSLRTDRLRLHGLRARVLERFLRRADAVTVNSRAARALVTEKIGAEPARVTVVPNAIDLDGAPSPRAMPARPVVGYLGRFVKYKRVPLLVRAFERAYRARPDAGLLLVGDGPELESLRGMAAELRCADAVEFAGGVGESREWLARMSCLVVPSLSEGLSNAAMEALAMGVPVVAWPSGDMSEIVIEGKTGRLFTNDDPGELASLLVEVLGDESLQRAAAVEGPRILRERYTPRRQADTMRPVYHALTKQKGR